MEKIKELKAESKKIADQILSMAEDVENFDDAKQEEYDALVAKSETVLKQIDNLSKAEAARQSAEKMQERPAEPVARITQTEPMGDPAPKQENKLVIPANVRRGVKLQSFDNEEKAYSFGQFVRACNGIAAARTWCADHGIPLNVHNEGTNSQGGYLVPQQFENDIISLTLEYGVFRRNARVRPMLSDTLMIPRRTGGLTAYAVGESGTATESTKSWDQVSLVARKWAVLTRMTSELAEDAIINVADDLAVEMARAFAEKEDECGFNGDGTSTYNGITGATVALNAAAGTPTTTSAGGVIVGTDNVFSGLTLSDHNSVVAKCPTYARNGAKWYCSPFYFDAVMSKLAYAAGGNTAINIAGGVARQFLGYPVELTEVLPTSDANSQIVALFGNLAQAATFGDRRSTTIAFSDSATIGDDNVFADDQIAVRGTQRYDIKVHDVGSSTAAGPIVGLQSLNA